MQGVHLVFSPTSYPTANMAAVESSNSLWWWILPDILLTLYHNYFSKGGTICEKERDRDTETKTESSIRTV